LAMSDAVRISWRVVRRFSDVVMSWLPLWWIRVGSDHNETKRGRAYASSPKDC
jgi:hypothetical protein